MNNGNKKKYYLIEKKAYNIGQLLSNAKIPKISLKTERICFNNL